MNAPITDSQFRNALQKRLFTKKALQGIGAVIIAIFAAGSWWAGMRHKAEQIEKNRIEIETINERLDALEEIWK